MASRVWSDRRINWVFTLAILLIFLGSSPGVFSWHEWWIDLYVLLLAVWIWGPDREKTFGRGVLLVGFLALGVLVMGMSWGEREVAANLVWPLGGILGGRGHKSPWSQVALGGLTIIDLMLTFPYSLSSIAASILGLFGLYWVFRSVGIRRDAQALDRNRVKELEAAYTELQETHAKLIRTSQEAAEARARQTRLETLADIHDGVGHRLTSLIIGLESLEMMISDDPAEASTRLAELEDTARLALQDVRQAVRDRGESPHAEDMEALIAGAQEKGDFSVGVHWAVSPESLSAPLLGTVFHVLQEALTNILRHARAQHVRIQLSEKGHCLQFEVSDDGVLQTEAIPGFGIAQMQRRCQAMGGTLQLAVNVPHGMSLFVTLPYVKKEDEADADKSFLGRRSTTDS